MAATVFQETDQGNYVSTGSQGKIFVAKIEDGWIHGRISLDAESYPTDGHPKYVKPEEALREASADDGFIIDGKNSRNIGLRRISESKALR